jgi:hypothetical protein
MLVRRDKPTVLRNLGLRGFFASPLFLTSQAGHSMKFQKTEHSLLEINTAVACRIIRSAIVPREYFCWLANPSRGGNLPSIPLSLHPAVLKSMSALLNPVLEDAAPWELKETRNAAEWFTAISQLVAEKYSCRGMGFANRMLASSLLPMYRTLATGKLQEGFQQTRFRLTEMLSLLSLCQDLAASSVENWSQCELVQMLEDAFRKKKAPRLALEEGLGLNLVRVGEMVLQYAAEFDSSLNDFPPSMRAAICGSSDEDSQAIADWASPDLLWHLSGEMISKKSDMVLPRAWVETPVPWTSIGDHWNALSHRLTNLDASTNEVDAASAKENQPAGQVTGGLDSAESSVPPAQSASEPRSTHSVKMAPHLESLDVASFGEGAMPEAMKEATSPIDLNIDQIQEWLTEVRSVSEREEEVGKYASSIASPLSTPEPIIPKVLIAEIRSHNDPVFVNVLRRQIASCRADDRTVCLAKVVVLPEDETDHADICGVRDNGLTLWQQKLVNWLADRDNVADPYAFLTSDGELMLCVLDLERNEMTRTLRCGLIEVLTGQHIEDAGEMSLAKVHIPARFHVGIASTSSPGANFTPEQLIEPAIRCLSAASRQGKASLKSIEVF